MYGMVNKGISELVSHDINLSTLRLEEIIKDLNIILEVKKGLHHAYENISLEETTKKVLDMLAR